MSRLAHKYYIAPSYEQNNASNDDDDNYDGYHGNEVGNVIYRILFYASTWVTRAQKQDRRCRCLR